MEELRKIEKEFQNIFQSFKKDNELNVEEVNTLISRFNNSLKGMDSNTVLSNKTFILQLKYKLKMLRKYTSAQKGVKEDDIEPILNKECTIVV